MLGMAALVKNQIDKLNKFINKRGFAARKIIKGLNKFDQFLYLPKEFKNIKNSWFTFPIVVKKNKYFSKKMLTNFLTKNRIDNRPIIAGNIADQPFIKKFKYKKKKLTNSKLVMDSGFFIGLNHMLNTKRVNYIIKVFNKFFKNTIKE